MGWGGVKIITLHNKAIPLQEGRGNGGRGKVVNNDRLPHHSTWCDLNRSLIKFEFSV